MKELDKEDIKKQDYFGFGAILYYLKFGSPLFEDNRSEKNELNEIDNNNKNNNDNEIKSNTKENCSDGNIEDTHHKINFFYHKDWNIILPI